ncbi:MAG TPA: Gfo/Idh/MocA family oxidoreductase [Flavobacterium sp.]|nr:Gfo/Idh/MocA family oxidoreductase [Flavobacterium sp.]
MIVSSPEIKSKKLSLGFIGVGWIGRNRMEVLLNSGKAEAKFIAEPSEENRREAFKAASDAEISDIEAICKENIDGIVIATPSAMHAGQAVSALNSGKAVFCQKPLGRNAAEVKEAIEASEKAGKLLAVDLSYRYTKAFQAVHEVVASGAIGHVFAVELKFHNAYGPDKGWFYDISQSGGGCVMDLGVHLIDLALSALGFPEIKEISSHLFSKGKKLQKQEDKVEDFASVAIVTEQETAISLECSWHVSAGRDAVIEAKFYGTGGGAAFTNTNGSFYDFKAERYNGTQTEVLFDSKDDWQGKAGVDWAEKVLGGQGFDKKTAAELIKTSIVIDRIYGR